LRWGGGLELPVAAVAGAYPAGHPSAIGNSEANTLDETALVQAQELIALLGESVVDPVITVEGRLVMIEAKWATSMPEGDIAVQTIT
jgi:hypothetical protein